MIYVEIVKIDPKKLNLKKLRVIGKRIKEGAIVAYPTDTVYGMGGNPWSASVIDKILQIKRRDWVHGIPVLLANRENVKEFGEMPPIGQKIADIFWPGPVTIVIPKDPTVPDKLSGQNDSIALRIPNHPITLKLIEFSGGALIGTNASIHKQIAPSTAVGVVAQLGDVFDYLIDGGTCYREVPSTVVSVWNDGSIEILREGAVPGKEIFQKV
ncbi:MAG: hypothetical protein RBG13Loki_3628 [Promethearchaeota archaeon CR_4]|nr:MAG: hypothetical protein RBG13Loki_3628 [Candidatus Lokiarchaeota archaeon CR_4]